ncbi:MAG: Asp-tRNA(Asn)/Glu-tRNA(Gln) amidotransferase subunit GatC [Negativicutes bacterium]|nr:Asp-tRNA(Asn)/Glu-tRNA(Gln) amidotransferase subunit GatC [Negativicutes bacterium]
MIDEKTVRDVARLSRLEVDDRQVEVLARQMGDIIGYMDMLSRIDTENVEPMAHVVPISNVWRPDSLRPSMPNQEAIRLAPDAEGEYFRTPKVVSG